jgi:hypothetical protein
MHMQERVMSTPRPVALGIEPSFGFGDRLGLATPGHLVALRAEGGPIRGIFPQQSIREMARTNRTPDDVMTAACDALAAERFGDPFGADADHLKTEQDVDDTADAGFTFFTIDPSDHVDQAADNYVPRKLEAMFAAVRQDVDWIDQYRGKTIRVPDGPTLTFDAQTIQRAVVKYGKAIRHALDLAAYIAQATKQRGNNHEIELSVDETDQPTTLAEHYIIADQCRQADMKLVSLAPRYIGEFEKGVDYKGDPRKLERTINDHAAIARHLGPYKLSLHSGSDKLSMYTAFARAARGLIHVKTAGTSYLEALRVVARHDAKLFRRMIDFARERYDTDKATYHVSGTVEGTPAPADVSDDHHLEQIYLECWSDVPEGNGFTAPGRQILHCTFGSTLTDSELGPALRQVLEAHPDTYTVVLADHFARHLRALRAGM